MPRVFFKGWGKGVKKAFFSGTLSILCHFSDMDVNLNHNEVLFCDIPTMQTGYHPKS